MPAADKRYLFHFNWQSNCVRPQDVGQNFLSSNSALPGGLIIIMMSIMLPDNFGLFNYVVNPDMVLLLVAPYVQVVPVEKYNRPTRDSPIIKRAASGGL